MIISLKPAALWLRDSIIFDKRLTHYENESYRAAFRLLDTADGMNRTAMADALVDIMSQHEYIAATDEFKNAVEQIARLVKSLPGEHDVFDTPKT